MGYDRKLFSSFYKEPDDNECHVYYAHQDGRIFCVPNVPVAGSASPGEEILCGVDRLTLMCVFDTGRSPGTLGYSHIQG